jgi:hypothetical protein
VVPVRIIIRILQPLGSLSRLHAVIQYRGDGDAFLYDGGSTHGTFLNKRRLKARVHAPLRVGDTFHLAESTRTYFFQGPSELAPAADVITKRASEEAARQQQQEAMRGNPKPTPGDIIDESGVDVDVDWRRLTSFCGLTEKQRVRAEKIQTRERKCDHLRARLEALGKKGEAGTELMRVSRQLQDMEEEVRELILDLEDSIRTSALAKKGISPAGLERLRARRQALAYSDDDSDGNMVDVAATKRRDARTSSKAIGQKSTDPTEEAWTVKALAGRVSVLEKEERRLAQEVAIEGSFLDDDSPLTMKVHMDEKSDLDAFMNTMRRDMERDKVSVLRREWNAVRADLQTTRELLAIADPDYKGGDGALQIEEEKARNVLVQERVQRMREDMSRRSEAAKLKRKRGVGAVED